MESISEDQAGMTPQEMQLARMLGNPEKMLDQMNKDTRGGYKLYGRQKKQSGGLPIVPIIAAAAPIIAQGIKWLIGWIGKKIAKKGSGINARKPWEPTNDAKLTAAEGRLQTMHGPQFWGQLRKDLAKHGGRVVSSVYGIPRATADAAIRPMLQKMIPRGLAAGKGLTPTGGSYPSPLGKFMMTVSPVVHFILHRLNLPKEVHDAADALIAERFKKYEGRGLTKTGGANFFGKVSGISKKIIGALLPQIRALIPKFKELTIEQSDALIDRIVMLVPKPFRGIAHGIATGIRDKAVETVEGKIMGIMGKGEDDDEPSGGSASGRAWYEKMQAAKAAKRGGAKSGKNLREILDDVPQLMKKGAGKKKTRGGAKITII